MCAYKSKLYIAYKGWNDSSLWLNIFDGQNWAGESSIQGRTSHAPSMALYQGRLYIAYKGWDNDSLWINSCNGREWSGEQPIAGAPCSSPALAVLNNRLYACWNQGDFTIWMSVFDGNEWTEPRSIAGRTNCSPALGVFADSLYIAYKGWNRDTLWVNRFDGTACEGEWQVSGRTNLSPSLTAYRGHLFMSYKGWRDERIWLNALAWIRWEGEVNIPGQTECTPYLAEFNGKLYMSYRDGNSRIHIDTLDGVGWAGEHPVPGNTNLSPAAVIYRGEIWVARTGSDNRMHLVHSAEGDDWSGEILPIGRTNDSPALANWRGNLCMAYKGWNNHSLWLNLYDGDNWIGEQPIIGCTTSQAPALTSHIGLLFIAYKGGNDNILRINYCDGIKNGNYHWVGEQQVAGSSSDISPALISFRGKLYLVYKQVGSTHICWRYGRWNGNQKRIDWDVEKSIPGSTSDTPALAVFGNQLYMLYKGSNDHDIYFNVFDKNLWDKHLGDSHLGWLGVYDSTLTGGLTDRSPALICSEGLVYAIYKGWDDDTVWLNSYRILQAWKPVPPAGFDPLNPLDARGEPPKCLSGEPLNHCFETAHLQIFWNESEPEEAVSPSDARRVSDFVECAWEVFTNSSLSDGHRFFIDLNSPHLKSHPRKLPIWIKILNYDNIDVNSGGEGPAISISPQGGLCGCAGEGWGPKVYDRGYDSTGPHELGHVMNKSYSYFFNSGGSGLRFINEGFVDVYRTILDWDYPNHKYYPFLDHLDLHDVSLVNSEYDGRRFWFYLASTFSKHRTVGTEITDPDWGYYEWSEIPFELRETFRNAAGSISPQMKVRRMPGRDVLQAIQSEFGKCHPKGRYPIDSSTQECDQIDPECADRHNLDPTRNHVRRWGCVPPKDQLYRLMPLAMRNIDKALSLFWPDEEDSALKCRAFRKFLEKNLLANGVGAIVDENNPVPGTDNQYELLSYGCNIHRIDWQINEPHVARILTVTLSSEDIPDGEWSSAAYYIDGGNLILAHGWQPSEGEIRMSFYREKPVVVIVAGFYFGFNYTGGQLEAKSCSYTLNERKRPLPSGTLMNNEQSI
jgi:hypothetical protein